MDLICACGGHYQGAKFRPRSRRRILARFAFQKGHDDGFPYLIHKCDGCSRLGILHDSRNHNREGTPTLIWYPLYRPKAPRPFSLTRVYREMRTDWWIADCVAQIDQEFDATVYKMELGRARQVMQPSQTTGGVTLTDEQLQLLKLYTFVPNAWAQLRPPDLREPR
jgi:hypothetical protein